MTLILKEKFSFKKKMQVHDENEQLRYFVEGKAISFGNKIHISDALGTDLAFIHQKVLSIHNKYFIEIGENTYEMKTPVVSIKPHFYLDGVNWEIKGDFFAHNFEIRDENETLIAKVHEGWLHIMDQYSIEIPDQANELLALCAIIIVDCVQDQQTAAASSPSTN